MIFLFVVTADIIMQLSNFTDDWCKYFGSSEALEVSSNVTIPNILFTFLSVLFLNLLLMCRVFW